MIDKFEPNRQNKKALEITESALMRNENRSQLVTWPWGGGVTYRICILPKLFFLLQVHTYTLNSKKEKKERERERKMKTL